MGRGCRDHVDVRNWIREHKDEEGISISAEIEYFSNHHEELAEKIPRNEVEEIARTIVRYNFVINYPVIGYFNLVLLDGLC